MRAPSSQLIELPDRLTIRHTGKWWHTGITLVYIVLLAALFWLFPDMTSRAPAIFGDDKSWLRFLFLTLLCSLLPGGFLGLREIFSGYALSISADGWVKCGGAAWRFPGPMTVRSVMPLGLGKTKETLELTYGAFGLRLDGCASNDLTRDFARRMTQWARSRIGGIPDPGRARGSDMGNLSTPSRFLPLVFFVSFFVWLRPDGGFFRGYFLSTAAASSRLALGAVAMFAVAAFLGIGQRWLRLARREIKAGALVWASEVLTALLLLIPCGMTVFGLGQILALRMHPAQEITLRQTVKTWTSSKGMNCRRYILIDEPSLGRSVNYAAYEPECDRGWKDQATVEIRQAQSELGVRILSVRRVETP